MTRGKGYSVWALREKSEGKGSWSKREKVGRKRAERTCREGSTSGSETVRDM